MLKSWLYQNEKKLYIPNILRNPAAVKYIESKIESNGIDWISWSDLCLNPSAVHIIEAYISKIREDDWFYLCANSGACKPGGLIMDELILTNWESEKIDWFALCRNSGAIEILTKVLHDDGFHSDKLKWNYIFLNESAGDMIKEYIYLVSYKSSKINWRSICSNTGAADIIRYVLEKEGPNSKKLYWSELSGNSSVIDILKKYQTRIDFVQLSRNTAAIDLLKKYKKRLNWKYLCANPVAFDAFIEPEYYKHGGDSRNLHWNSLSSNPSIFAI